jgi:hypothetical protein
MPTTKTYPKVTSVRPAEGKCLLVTFDNAVRKVYDCKPLFDTPPFHALKDDWLFKTVHPDPGGYGVSWTDDIDLSESELWEHGAIDQ